MRNGICAFTGIWFDKSMAKLRSVSEEYFAEYKRLGGSLEHMLEDSELGEPSWATSNIQNAKASHACIQERWLAIQTDSRWPAVLSTLKIRGFNPGNVYTANYLATAMAPINTTKLPLHGWINYTMNQAIFDEWMWVRMGRYWSDAIFQPARAHFPKVQHSNFGFYLFSPADCHMQSSHKVDGPFGLNCTASMTRSFSGALTGNVQAPSMYDDGNSLLSIRRQVISVRQYVFAGGNTSSVRPWVMGKTACLHIGCGTKVSFNRQLFYASLHASF